MNKNWSELRICLSGGESTGKTTLSKILAEHYGTVWVPEWARSFLDGRDFDQVPFVAKDFEDIAVNHLKAVESGSMSLRISGKNLLFVDTDAIITLMWAEHLIGNCPNLARQIASETHYDVFLINDPDVPYEKDPQRFIENHSERVQFHEKLLKELDSRQQKYYVIGGTLADRKKKCIEIIDSLLRK